jgi:hypothetical protein
LKTTRRTAKSRTRRRPKKRKPATNGWRRNPPRRVRLADGGREADFEKEWPKLRDEGRRRRKKDEQ